VITGVLPGITQAGTTSTERKCICHRCMPMASPYIAHKGLSCLLLIYLIAIHMKQLILHIPHSSVNIPFKEGYVADSKCLDAEILKLTDWYTDDLFFSAKDKMVVADFSRIFCDPERFEEDSQEVMSTAGMGVLYEKTDAGEILRSVAPEDREHILATYYRPHHQLLSKAVAGQLEQYGKAVIIDCHSYPDIPLQRDTDQRRPRPDFNIGTDPFHTDPQLVEASIQYFDAIGYTLGVDWPYKGSIVPMGYYEKDKQVQSIMLEVNRRLYLEEGTAVKSARYSEVKRVVQGFLETIRGLL
jgi:N-formylglutamate deformylase